MLAPKPLLHPALLLMNHTYIKEEIIDHGDSVNCDLCNGDYTESTQCGGLMFGSYAVCPKCQPALEKSIATSGDQKRVRDRAEKGETFKDFVMRIRKGNNTTRIVSVNSSESPTRTPYAVICDRHGQVFLTEPEYSRQLSAADDGWKCPRCGRRSDWDDDNYEKKENQ